MASSSSSSAASTNEVALVSTSNTQSQPIFDFKAYLDRTMYYNKLFIDTGVRLPLVIMSAMLQAGIWDSFQKILEDKKHDKDAIIAKAEADNKNRCAHLYDDISDEDEEQNNTHGIIETSMKRQKISHTDTSTQTAHSIPVGIVQYKQEGTISK
ncbi:unnamed protein product [Adineta steineri]|uniref:Uncharacterized protein n=1 Tax=Adineta steineri TaxID=433720 RepID=A0A815RV57_9BILA|nr:unnamed protein product [Adineta steineri]CAF4048205.1 unnamed protein product [Adineta steineri]